LLTNNTLFSKKLYANPSDDDTADGGTAVNDVADNGTKDGNRNCFAEPQLYKERSANKNVVTLLI